MNEMNKSYDLFNVFDCSMSGTTATVTIIDKLNNSI